MPVARDLERPVLLDQLPKLLERLAEAADQAQNGDEVVAPIDTADEHARERLEVGFDLNEVVAEYAILRQTMLSWLVRDVAPDHTDAFRAVNQVLDHAMRAAVARYIAARDRSLEAFDRIAAAALEYSDVGDLLRRLLQVFLETTAGVDTAAILLREGDELVVHADVGLDSDGPPFRARLGEGFAGKIALERVPLFIPDGSESPLVSSAALRKSGVRALYGVPLLSRDEVIGVALIGSCSAREFSQQDRVLFVALANRATTAILQGLLRARLEQERGRLRAIVEQLPAGVVIAEVPSGRVLLANEQVSQIWRRPVETPPVTIADYGKGWEGFDPETGRRLEPHEWALARAIREDAVVSQEVEILRGDHTRGIILSNAAPIREGGRIVAGVATFVDVTPHKQALRAREEILSIVSHDLRNPLNVVAMSAALLQQPKAQDPARARKATDAIVRASQRMTRLIDDLIDFASMQSGRLSIQRAPHDAKRLVEDAVTSFEELAAGKRLTLQAQAEEHLPRVSCDRDRVLQIFSNLVGNAIKLTSAGGAITVGASPGLGSVRFWVSDTGPGISSEELPYIFDRYWRGTRTAHEGSGLGLAIAKALVAAHGGHIWVESEVGVGSTFHFSVPSWHDG